MTQFRVIVPFRDPGPELDDCLESLLHQEGSWLALIVDEGSAADHEPRVPTEDPRVSFRRGEVGAQAQQWLAGAAADDAVVILESTRRFRDSDALRRTVSTAPAGGAVQASLIEGICEPVDLSRGLQAAVGGGAPRISCLMVTRDRVSLARRAIRSYADQAYPNRELVIVTDGTERYRASLARYASFIDAKNVRFADPGRPGQTLGALRNLSIDAAGGELICQWDDDDCSHPERLSAQAAHLRHEGALASFMTEHLQFMAGDGTLFWIDWTLGGQGRGQDFVAPGTLLMVRDPRFRYPVTGPRARRGEDSVFLQRLHAMVPVTHFTGAGHLYLYRYHGRNTFSRAHHRALGDYRRTTIAHLQAHETELRTAAAYYGIAGPVTVLGREGPAFNL